MLTTRILDMAEKLAKDDDDKLFLFEIALALGQYDIQEFSDLKIACQCWAFVQYQAAQIK